MNFFIMSAVFANVFKLSGASEEIVKMMKYQPQVNSSGGKVMDEKEVVGEIELKNITFRYPTKKDVIVAKKINLKVEQNKVVALVG